ncbi:MAG: hypothetical protein IVW36_00775 [Dehalococcoidia bacterium]|nr:hypothetical protein [Dehalococcoidia bacterium]
MTRYDIDLPGTCWLEFVGPPLGDVVPARLELVSGCVTALGGIERYVDNARYNNHAVYERRVSSRGRERWFVRSIIA